MTLIGLDLNSSRVRAIQGEKPGSGSLSPVGVPLEGNERELALALSLEERRPRVGRAGVGLCRRSPHLSCMDFLPYLGTDRRWEGGRHRLAADAALALVCEHLRRQIVRAEGVTVALPAYFSAAQAGLLTDVAGRTRWPLLGTVPSPLVLAIAARHRLPSLDQIVVVDLDCHALTFSAVSGGEDRVRVLHVHTAPRLSRSAWLSRLLDGVANRCIRLSRRDPRESAETEQAVFDQLAAVLDSRAGGEPVELVLQTPHWYQNLKLSADEIVSFCSPLLERTIAEMQQFLTAIAASGPVGGVLLTGVAARVPGLAVALEELIHPPLAELPAEDEEDDFGEALIEGHTAAAGVHVLDDDAAARAALDLAFRQNRGDLPRGHLECAAMPGRADDDRGPTRLPFRGTA